MIGALLFGYAIFGVALAAGSLLVVDEHPRVPPGAEPAVLFLIGLLWPLVIVASVVFGLYRCGARVVNSFRVLAMFLRGSP